MKYLPFGAALLLLPVAGIAAQTLNIVAIPSTAVIFRLKPLDNSLVAIGTGTVQLKLEKNDPNTIVVRQEGFREMLRSFPKDDKYKDKVYTIFLTKRIAQFAALQRQRDGGSRGGDSFTHHCETCERHAVALLREDCE